MCIRCMKRLEMGVKKVKIIDYFFEDKEELEEWCSYVGKLVLFLIISTILMLILRDIRW